MRWFSFWICLYIVIFDTDGFIVPDEIPTALSVIYSNIPKIKLGSDSRIGWGFRLGDRVDAQILLELGPQHYTQPLANQQPFDNPNYPELSSSLDTEDYDDIEDTPDNEPNTEVEKEEETDQEETNEEENTSDQQEQKGSEEAVIKVEIEAMDILLSKLTEKVENMITSGHSEIDDKENKVMNSLIRMLEMKINEEKAKLSNLEEMTKTHLKQKYLEEKDELKELIVKLTNYMDKTSKSRTNERNQVDAIEVDTLKQLIQRLNNLTVQDNKKESEENNPENLMNSHMNYINESSKIEGEENYTVTEQDNDETSTTEENVLELNEDSQDSFSNSTKIVSTEYRIHDKSLKSENLSKPSQNYSNIKETIIEVEDEKTINLKSNPVEELTNDNDTLAVKKSRIKENIIEEYKEPRTIETESVAEECNIFQNVTRNRQERKPKEHCTESKEGIGAKITGEYYANDSLPMSHYGYDDVIKQVPEVIQEKNYSNVFQLNKTAATIMKLKEITKSREKMAENEEMEEEEHHSYTENPSEPSNLKTDFDKFIQEEDITEEQRKEEQNQSNTRGTKTQIYSKDSKANFPEEKDVVYSSHKEKKAKKTENSVKSDEEVLDRLLQKLKAKLDEELKYLNTKSESQKQEFLKNLKIFKILEAEKKKKLNEKIRGQLDIKYVHNIKNNFVSEGPYGVINYKVFKALSSLWSKNETKEIETVNNTMNEGKSELTDNKETTKKGSETNKKNVDEISAPETGGRNRKHNVEQKNIYTSKVGNRTKIETSEKFPSNVKIEMKELDSTKKVFNDFMMKKTNMSQHPNQTTTDKKRSGKELSEVISDSINNAYRMTMMAMNNAQRLSNTSDETTRNNMGNIKNIEIKKMNTINGITMENKENNIYDGDDIEERGINEEIKAEKKAKLNSVDQAIDEQYKMTMMAMNNANGQNYFLQVNNNHSGKSRQEFKKPVYEKIGTNIRPQLRPDEKNRMLVEMKMRNTTKQETLKQNLPNVQIEMKEVDSRKELIGDDSKMKKTNMVKNQKQAGVDEKTGEKKILELISDRINDAYRMTMMAMNNAQRLSNRSGETTRNNIGNIKNVEIKKTVNGFTMKNKENNIYGGREMREKATINKIKAENIFDQAIDEQYKMTMIAMNNAQGKNYIPIVYKNHVKPKDKVQKSLNEKREGNIRPQSRPDDKRGWRYSPPVSSSSPQMKTNVERKNYQKPIDVRAYILKILQAVNKKYQTKDKK